MDGIIAFGAGSQIGELSIGAVAGRDIVTQNTIISPAAPPVIERAPLRRPPRPIRGFRDREAERAQLTAECRPRGGAWISGSGGSGATALLRQLAGAEPPDLPDGVALLLHTDLPPADAADTRAGLMLDDIAQLLFDRFYRSNDPTRRIRIDIARAGAYLGPLQALVALDRPPLSRAQIERLADTLAGSAIFVAAPGPPSELLLDLNLRGLPRADALALLAAACGSDPADPNAAPHLEAICAVLDNQPLPLQLAGALIQTGAARLPTLAAVAAGMSDAPNALNRACRLSLEVLTSEERRLLTALTVGEPDLAVDALAAISGLSATDVAAPLERLAALRLIAVGGERAAISTPSLRQELARLLEPNAERKRAAAFFAAAAAAKTLTPAWVAREAQNMLAAAQTAESAALPGLVGPLARALHPHALLSGQWNAWQRLADLALRAAERENDAALRAWALHEQGTLALFSGAPQTGVIQLQQALALRMAAADPAAPLTQQNLTFAAGAPGKPTWTKPLRAALGGLALLLFVGLGLFVTNPPPPSPTVAATATSTALLAALPTQPATSPTAAPTTPAPSSTPVPPTATPASPTPTTSLSPAAAATSTPTPTSTLAGSCRVIAPALNLRQGPGPAYPVLRILPNGTLVEPFAQAFDGAWLEVRVDQQQGWIARSGPQPLLDCFSDFSDLPPGIIPALPTPTPTPSPIPTATATVTPTPTPTPDALPTNLPTLEPPTREPPTPTSSVTPAPTRRPDDPEPEPPTATAAPTATPNPAPTATSSPAPTATPSPLPEPTVTPSPIIPG